MNAMPIFEAGMISEFRSASVDFSKTTLHPNWLHTYVVCVWPLMTPPRHLLAQHGLCITPFRAIDEMTYWGHSRWISVICHGYTFALGMRRMFISTPCHCFRASDSRY